MPAPGPSRVTPGPGQVAEDPERLERNSSRSAVNSRVQSLAREWAQCPTGPNRGRALLAAVVLLLVVGWVDYLTTYEISLLTFYWIPVALATWCLGARTGYGFAVASVGLATAMDLVGGLVRTKYFYLCWDIFSALLSFFILVWMVAKLKQLYLETAKASRLEVELRASQRTFEELRGFGYVIGHNWHAPLRSIDGYSQALLEEYAQALGPGGREYLRRLRGSAHQMAGLTNALLELIKYSGGKLAVEPVELSALVQAIGRELNAARPEHPVELSCEAGLRVMGDAALLRIALERLMDNAWKFTRQQAPARVAFGALRRPDGPVYFLRDNGLGFSVSDPRTLFTPYQSAHRPEEFAGVGIGLPIADRIISRHGGRIWAEGAEGKGATFYFTLSSDSDAGHSALA